MPPSVTTSLRHYGPFLSAKQDKPATAVDDTTTSEVAPPSATSPGEQPEVLKAVRAFEHDRQRALKTVETDRVKERRERQRTGVRAGGARAPRTYAPRHCRTVYGKKGGVWEADTNDGGGEKIARCEVAEEPGAGRERVREVPISQLVKPARTRAPRAGDFELVPNVRSVIVLDDHDPAAELETDDPWEHVSAHECTHAETLVRSYAEIAASTK